MKSDNWLMEKIIEESLKNKDISYMRILIQEGMSDEEILANLRKRMFFNSTGMRAYIRQEKIRALMLKLSYRIHWVLLLPLTKKWLKEKEILIRWKEGKHCNKIVEKTKELRRNLLDAKYNKTKFDCLSTGDIPEDIMCIIENAAEDLLIQIEEEENNEFLKSKRNRDSFNHADFLSLEKKLQGKDNHKGKTAKGLRKRELESKSDGSEQAIDILFFKGGLVAKKQ